LIRETASEGTFAKRYPPVHYPWADSAFDLIHSSIVPCQVNLAQALKGEAIAETSGADNIKTIRLIFGSYKSARTGQVLHFE
jgi:D-apiose dehydrogenase